MLKTAILLLDERVGGSNPSRPPFAPGDPLE
jgi:hypothetical protein